MLNDGGDDDNDSLVAIIAKGYSVEHEQKLVYKFFENLYSKDTFFKV